MNYIILDLEATCWENEDKNGRQSEIIEIGAVKLNEHGRVTGEFCQFVRPKLYPMLSDFCHKLTTISQVDINRAEPYPIVIENFIDWIGYNDHEDYYLCSWGHYDKNQFAADCALHQLDDDWIENHYSLKHLYADMFRMKKPTGLKAAVRIEGLDWEGTHHRGIDDARNLAKIFVKYMNRWNFV